MHKLRTITAVDALLASALAAQAPHAATVFTRLAAEAGLWPTLHGYLYAAALEGATFYFVRTHNRRWAAFFAVVSILHNFAYYLTDSLDTGNILRASLISLALPLAIAAFSDERRQPATAPENAAPVVIAAETPKTQPAPAQRPTVDVSGLNETQINVLRAWNDGHRTNGTIAEVVEVNPSTVSRSLKALREGGHLNGHK
jgi:DNA-binding CsgD family transcriptional regulator